MSADPITPRPIIDPTTTFEDAAAQALRRVQRAFADVIESLPGRVERPHEIGKVLGLHKTLAWKVAKILDATDPFAIYQRIPGHGAVEKVLEAARALGIDPDRLDRVVEALQQLEALIVLHADDRETFEVMLANVARETPGEVELLHRKNGFRATTHIWGIQARTILRSVIVHPAAEADMLDAAVLFGCADLVRLHADRSWVVNRWRPTDDDGVPIKVVRETVDPTPPGAAPLLAEFSTIGHESLIRASADDGTVEDEIVAGPMGNAGAATFFTAEVVRSVMSRYRGPGNLVMAQNLDLRTPCRLVVFDHIVHEDLFGSVQPYLRVYGELAGRPLYSTLRSNRDRLDVFEEIEHLGTGPEVVRTRDVPRYEDMLRHVCARLGWDASRFDVYRVAIPFPYVPATITLGYPLPEAPA